VRDAHESPSQFALCGAVSLYLVSGSLQISGLIVE
jgi:hypothetical protein